MSDALVVRHTDGVATVTFNRPERLNAFRRSEYHELHALLGALEQQPEVRVVVLTGAGRGFCAGEDLKELDEDPTGLSPAAVRANVAVLQDITRRIVMSDRTYVAAVNGVAAGFGAELAVACDLRVGGTSARLLFPEVRRGLFITNGVSALLPHIVGRTWASTLLLSGQPVDAATAERIGLLTHCVPDEALAATADQVARALAGNAPMAMRLTKRILRDELVDALERALARETEYIVACLASGEYVEGAQAFVEKRAPRFGAGGGS